MANNVVNKKDGLVKFTSITDAQYTGGFDGSIIYIESTKTIYEYKSDYNQTPNNTSIISTVDGGNSRWVGISGQYGIYGSGNKPMLIVLTDSDFPLPDRTYRISDAYGQTYLIQLTLDVPTYIIFPNNIDASGNDFSLYYVSSTHDVYLSDYEHEWSGYLSDNNTIRTFVATNSTVSGSRWNEKEIYWVDNNAIHSLSKYWFNTEPNSTFKPHIFLGGSEGRHLIVSSTQGLEDYTNMYIFRNSTPYTMTLPTAASNYGRVLRLYRDGDGLITIARSDTDTFGSSDLTSLTLNNKQYIELVAANNNQWLITSQSTLSKEQAYLLSSGDYTPSRYIDTIICSNSTQSTISPNVTTVNVGKIYTIKRIGSGNVVINPHLSQTIDGNLTYTLTKVNDSITIQSNGTNWDIIGEYSKDINLDNTTFSNQSGIIKKNGIPFIHDFNYGNNGVVTTDGKNLFIGESIANNTMGENATSSIHASKNIAIGYNNLNLINNGYNNISIGVDNIINNIDSNTNITIGNSCLKNSTIGNGNIAIGMTTLSNCNSNYNVAIGGNCLTNLSGSTGFNGYNVAIGRDTLKYLEDGGDNVAVGYGAGMYHGVGNSSSNYHKLSYASVYIGDYCRSFEEDSNYEIVIGAYTIGHGSRTTTIGNNDGINNNTDTYLTGNLHNTGSVQIGDDLTSPSADNVGAIRYRETSNNSYVEMVMKTGTDTYTWEIIKSNSW